MYEFCSKQVVENTREEMIEMSYLKVFRNCGVNILSRVKLAMIGENCASAIIKNEV